MFQRVFESACMWPGKVGDKVKLHGTKIKKAKNSTGPGVFKVEKLNRSYGPCPIVATTASVAH